MHLHAQRPGVVAQHQPGHLLIGQHRDSVAVLAVGRTLHLGNGVLPLVEEHRAARTVGHDEIGLVGRHALQFLVRIGDRIAAVGLHEVVAETESTAVPAFGIVDYIAAPRLDHAGQYIRKFRPSDTGFRKYLGIVAADVLDDFQRFARRGVDEPFPGLCGDLLPEMEHDVRGVGQARGLLELTPGRLPEVLAGLLLRLGELVPCGQNLRIDAERGDARSHEVLIPRLAHQRELPRHDGHDRLQRHDVRMVADTRARRVLGVVREVLAQVVAQHVDKQLFAARKEILPDAAARVIIVVVGDLLLIVLPTLSLHGHLNNARCYCSGRHPSCTAGRRPPRSPVRGPCGRNAARWCRTSRCRR